MKTEISKKGLVILKAVFGFIIGFLLVYLMKLIMA
ncbi:MULTISPECIES: DUF3395 domain-containing protein [Flavobacterium]|jgi:hypothetical protein|nr:MULTISPECIES: DUF3395 domain-containing protein [Flavobacterium]